MRIAFTFRQLDPSDAIKNYASEKLGKLQKYLRAPLDAEVTLSLERHLHQVEVVLRCDGHTYVATEQSDDMYASIDLVADTIESQVRRTKGATQDRRRQANSTK
jgi:putative sigma-54 modulation protein